MLIFRGILSIGLMVTLPAAANAHTFDMQTGLSQPVTQAIGATQTQAVKTSNLINGINTGLNGINTGLNGINTGLNVYNTLNPHLSSSPGQGGGEFGIPSSITTAISGANAALQFWNIIQENKPTLQIDSKVASALPTGSGEDWTNLTGWQADRSVQFETVIHSALYKTDAIALVYEVQLKFGGSLNGHGRYIAAARVVPTKINVAWGYDLNVKVIVASTFNAGTADDPVGAIELVVQYTYGTILKNKTLSNTYLVRGDGMIQDKVSGKVFFQPFTGDEIPPTPDPTPAKAITIARNVHKIQLTTAPVGKK